MKMKTPKKRMKIKKMPRRKTILLSICIPTYNRADFLDETISSVVNQVAKENESEVELCISDNASTDATDELVKKWKRKSRIRITYHKNRENLGVDRNFLKSIEIAHGRYCWFLGSDDAIENGAVKKAVEKVKENPEIGLFILTQSNYDFHLKNKIPDNYPLPKKFSTDRKFKDSFEAISHAGYALGFISVLLFDRKKWLEVKGDDKFIGSGYIHMYKTMSMIRNGAKVMYVRDDKMMRWRADNDEYLKIHKIYKRLALDLEGYYKISASVFGEYSKEHKKIVNQLMDTYLTKYCIANAKLHNDKKAEKELFRLYVRHLKGFPKFWIKIFPYMLVPTFIYRIIAKLMGKKLPE